MKRKMERKREHLKRDRKFKERKRECKTKR